MESQEKVKDSSLDADYSPLKEIPCVILAGGKSSRMKVDKALLSFGDADTIIEYQYSRLKPFFKHTYISSKNNKFDFHADLILDDSEIFSPMVALKKIFETIKEDKIFIITVDTPFVSFDTIKEIINSSNNYEITVAKSKKTHNLCGCFSKILYDKVSKLIESNMHKVNYLLNNSNTHYVEFQDEQEFTNINIPDDYNNALRLISKLNNSY